MMPKSRVHSSPAEMANSTSAAPRSPRPRREELALTLPATLTLPSSTVLCGLGHPPGGLDSPVGPFPPAGVTSRGANRAEAAIPCAARDPPSILRHASCRSEWWHRFGQVD